MHTGNVVGLQQTKLRIEHYTAQRRNALGYWTPAKLLFDLAAAGGKFGEP